jgi:hypothetical protein
MERSYHERQGFKWYALFFAGIVTGFLLYYGLIPLFNLAFVTSRPNSDLESELQALLPSISLEEATPDNLMLLSWDMANRKPYILTKQSVKDQELYKPFDKLDKATLVSAVNPLYFKPYAEDSRVLISGNVYAESPAMLAYLYASENGQASEDIRVFSVGSILRRADKIPEDVGVAEWVPRLESLQGPSKRHSQDYMVNQVLMSYNSRLIKFQYPVPVEVASELGGKRKRLEDLEHYKSDMINENRLLLEIAIEELVKERFC